MFKEYQSNENELHQIANKKKTIVNSFLDEKKFF